MNYFPNSDEEINLIKFLAQFQYINVSDTKYFFKSKKYYRYRISNLISKKFIKKVKLNLVLDELGIEYCKQFNYKFTKRNRNKKYLPRLLYLSHLGAIYHNCDTIKFTPSYSMKDKNSYTITARRFIGILEINGIDYLAYNISKNHDNKYLTSVIYDIQKEKKYKNIIILINDKKRINVDNFAFGMNQVIVMEDSSENLEKLKYQHSIAWSKILKDNYKNEMSLAEYNFCDYTDHNNKYISLFYFLNTEKINRIKYFLRENKNKNADIICSKELEQDIRKELPNATYIIVDFENYIDKEINIYD